MSCNPAIPLLSIYPKEILTQETVTIMLISSLFQIEKTGHWNIYWQENEWINYSSFIKWI